MYKIILRWKDIWPGYWLCAFVIIALAILLRLLLISQNWPQTDSDEGTMGLMALHVAYRGELPIFFYGQGFVGSLEAYLGAVSFHLFGPSTLALRLGVITLFAFFLVNMYLLTSLLYTKKLALLTLVLLGTGSSETLFRELEAAGGYPETLFFGSLLLLYASWLALSSSQGQSTHSLRWRMLVYGGWGLLVGLAIWSNPLLIPFILMACLLLLRFCRADLSKSVVLAMALGFMIPVLPIIVYNFTVPIDKSTLAVIGVAVWVQGKVLVTASPLMKIAGTVLVSLPLATGGMSLCPISPEAAWPLSQLTSSDTIQCTIVHGAWGLGFIVLWVVATVLGVRAYWKVRPSATVWPAEERQSAIRHFARLMILGSTGLTLALLTLSSPAGLLPWSSARYLVGLLIAIPALVWPIWSAVGTIKLPLLRLATLMTALRYGVLALLGITFLLGTVGTFLTTPTAQASNRQQYALIHDLLRLGITHIYADYWTCDRIIFQSEEQIICSVVDEQLQPGLDRYLLYRTIVTSYSHPAYVFPVDSLQAAAFAQRVGHSSGGYQRFVFDGYLVYQPEASP